MGPGASGTQRDRLAEGVLGPELVRIPGGRFLMGSRRRHLHQDEQPERDVSLAPFWIGKYEVTFAEYDPFATATGRPLPDDEGWGRGRRPVVNVSWADAQAFTRWLSRRTGGAYRLPSEAEWEYASRAGSVSSYWWGFGPEPGRAVCFDCGTRWDNRSTAPVGSLAANPFGLHDTAGNAMEWVQDCASKDYSGAPDDGRPWLQGDCSQRMARGGAFNKPATSLRTTARFPLPADSQFEMVGFRVARDEPAPAAP
jgi:formylglycine-generating enzyme required for sulfatase activity